MKLSAIILLLSLHPILMCGGAESSHDPTDSATYFLLQQVEVDSGGVYLDEVIRPQVGIKIPHLKIAGAPQFGETGSLTRMRLNSILKDQAPDLLPDAWDGVDAIRITRKFRTLGQDELQAMISTRLQAEYIEDDGRLELEFSRPWKTVTIPDEELTMTIGPLPTSGIASYLIVRIGMVDVEVSVVESDWKEEPALLATLRDVTMRKENEATRIASERRNQQSQKLESLGMLSGGISHGLNNLLTVILANASMVKADTDPQSHAYQSLQHVESAAIEAADACVALLNYTGGVRPVEIARLKVNELVENHERMLEFALAKDISLHFDLNDSLPDIDGDPALLCQVLMNLAGNASEAKSDDSPAVWIRTGLANLTPADADRARWPQEIDGGEYVYLEVKDNGNGMDDETLNKIYDPFFSTRFTGRGMGMAVVMGIIRAHSGMIAIDTSPGDGTKVRVYLPPVVTTGSTIFMAREDFEDPPLAKLRRPARDGVMLVVDDEKMICRTGAMVLESLGFQTAEALTGEQAIEWFTKNHTDCVGVLLDYAMPGMSGDQVLTRLLEIKPDIPVIFTSGHARDAEVSTLMDLGDIVFLPKPFDIDALEQAIDQLM